MQTEVNHLNIGYIPLLDCIALLWAKKQGYFDEVGLNVNLIREASWASLRDRLAFGFLDAAHCLSAILPATSLGVDQLAIPLQTPIVLSQNRAFITLKQSLCLNAGIKKRDSVQVSAEKLLTYLGSPSNLHSSALSLAHVFKHSIHHYCLREWLALADENFAKTIQLQTLPPPFMADALKSNAIQGFCVGEPWNTQSEIEGTGYRILSSQEIIPNVADKVLAVTQEWAQTHPHTLYALCSAIEKAQMELKQLDNYAEVWSLLIDFNIIRFECSPEVHVAQYFEIQNIIKGFIQDSHVPKHNDFEWLMTQMCRWDNLELSDKQIKEISQQCILKFMA